MATERFLTLALLASVLSGAAPQIAMSDVETPDCGPYDGSDVSTQASTEKRLATIPGGTLEACESANGHRYYLISPVQIDPFGVCRYSKREVFVLEGDGGTRRWSFSDPSQESVESRRRMWMSVSKDGVCKNREDATYVPAEGVSGGVFLALSSFWSRVSSGDSPLDAGAVGPSGLEEGPLAELVRALRRPAAETDPVQLVGIGIDDGTTDVAPHYDLHVQNSQSAWIVEADLGPTGARILGVAGATY